VTVAIIGSTASGKSSLAMAAAHARPGTEIVAVDSMQVYRRMDIGTAKPTPQDQAEVTHHGLDLADPIEDFTVVRFVEHYDHVRAAAKGPLLLVAGTGLYLRAMLDRFDPPGEWLDLRATFESEPDLAALYSKLELLDPRAAAKIDAGNRRRIARALEVCVGSGQPFSSFGPGMDAYPPIEITQIGLRWNRDTLRARIDQRVDDMMAQGLLHEVAKIGRANMSRNAQQALGYKELLDHLDGKTLLNEAVETIKVRTRQFAVKQERWFRRDPRIQWIDLTEDSSEALPAVLQALNA
jgi:tRNA dimethylallyltransferase